MARRRVVTEGGTMQCRAVKWGRGAVPHIAAWCHFIRGQTSVASFINELHGDATSFEFASFNFSRPCVYRTSQVCLAFPSLSLFAPSFCYPHFPSSLLLSLCLFLPFSLCARGIHQGGRGRKTSQKVLLTKTRIEQWRDRRERRGISQKGDSVVVVCRWLMWSAI